MSEPTESARFSWLVLLRAAGRALLRFPLVVSLALIAGWMGLIWTMSDRTFERPPELGSYTWRIVSNMAHAPLFGTLALLVSAVVLRRAPPADASRPHAPWPRVGPVQAAWVLLVTVAYGALDEWHQASVPGRDPSLADIGTDAVGALSVLWIIAYLGAGAASEAGIRRRLFVGIVACAAAATAVALAG